MCRELHERFMPEDVEPFNIKIIAQSLFLSTRLSTALSTLRELQITAHRESCGRFSRKLRIAPGDVENKFV
jgi:hypothetical protein